MLTRSRTQLYRTTIIRHGQADPKKGPAYRLRTRESRQRLGFPTLKDPKLESRSSTTFSFLKLKPSSHGVPVQKAHPLPLTTLSLHPFGLLSLLLLSRRQLPRRLWLHRGLHRRQSPIRSRLGQARLVSVLFCPLYHTQK